MCVFCLPICHQMLFSQEAHKVFVKQGTHGIAVDSADIDKFESELQDMLKVVEKHMESKEDDEKVCEIRMKQIIALAFIKHIFSYSSVHFYACFSSQILGCVQCSTCVSGMNYAAERDFPSFPSPCAPPKPFLGIPPTF